MQVLLYKHRSTGEKVGVVDAAIKRLVQALEERKVKVILTESIDDAKTIVASNVPVDCLLLTRTSSPLEPLSVDVEDELFVNLIDDLDERQPNVPLFLMAKRGRTTDWSKPIGMELAKRINEYLYIFEDSVEFVCGRIELAMRQYADQLLPPLIAAIKDYHRMYEHSWVIPGHQGGVGFTKTPAGNAFHKFFGENVFWADLNASRGQFGSLLGHSGAFKASEANIARIFGADTSFSGVSGGSGSNHVVMQHCIPKGATIIVDRNCHESITLGVALTASAQPVYMKSSNNMFSILGPVSRAEIRQAMAHQPEPVYGVITNSTFDGICYNSPQMERMMDGLRYLHVDEAWFAQARFNPLYANRHAMRGQPKDAATRPAVFVTQSSHKMLNGLGMGSFIHLRQGRSHKVNVAVLNQAFMMHTSTSPSYLISATNDMAAHMMDGKLGESLTQESINEAVDFRQVVASWHTYYNDEKNLKQGEGKWFFRPWNCETYPDGENGEDVPFEMLDAKKVATEQKYWMLKPGDAWHGFEGLDDDWVMLDPCKVSIITPGMDARGVFGESGVPAALVNAWLVHRGIVPIRVTDFQILFLFTIGVTKGKWGTLLRNLQLFKEHYDANAPLENVLPEIYRSTDQYKRKGITGLRQLADAMFAFLKNDDTSLPRLFSKAYDELPQPRMTPHEGYQQLIKNSVSVKVKDLAKRIVGTPIIPYPPGIPMLVAGECFGESAQTCPYIRYLSAVEQWDKEFPGFGHTVLGVEVDDDGDYNILCVDEK